MTDLKSIERARTEKASVLTVRDAVFELLRAFKVTTIFGNPGSTELPMFRSFPSDFRYVLGLQESVVAGMADGFAQATRSAALVNLHSAAGVGHSLGNLFTACKNYTPLIVTAGQQARSLLPLEAFLYAKNATEFPAPYVKWSCEPARAQDVPAAIARAFYVAMQPPRGPTFVSIPVDDWDQECKSFAPRIVSKSVFPDPTLISTIASALTMAHNPAIVVGAEVARDGAWVEIIALAERHNASVWVSPMSSRNSFPEDHRLFRGFLAADRARIVSTLEGHDVVLVAGAPVFTYHIEGHGPFIPMGATLYHLSDDPAVAAWAPVGTAITTSLKPALESLLAGSPPPARTAPTRKQPAPEIPPAPFTDAYALQCIAALRPPHSVIVEEAPSSRGAMHDYLPIVDCDGFYTCASGGLGYGLPAAIGVALGRPNEKILAILGDGSALYSIQGLWTAAELRLNVTFIIINNRRYEALNQFGTHFGLDRIIGTELPNVDFCKVASGFGLEVHRATNALELQAALLVAFEARLATLVEIVVE